MADKPKQSKLSKIVPQQVPEPEVDVNQEDITEEYAPLFFAVDSGNLESVSVLLKNGSDVNDGGRNVRRPLCIAVRNGNLDCVRVLLQHGADVNLMDCMERHPLYYALDNADVECTRLLLQHGADVKVDNQLPLPFVACDGHIPLAKLLLDYGADIHYSRYGYTAICSAVCRQQIDMVEFLLDHGADVNRIEKPGLLPIMGDLKCSGILELLLRRGAGLIWDRSWPYFRYFLESSATCQQLFVCAFFVPKYTAHMDVPHAFNYEYMCYEEVQKFMKSKKQYEADVPKLKQVCRAVIRHKVLENNLQSNLYCSLPLLPLPKLLVEYLLYSDWPHFFYTH